MKTITLNDYMKQETKEHHATVLSGLFQSFEDYEDKKLYWEQILEEIDNFTSQALQEERERIVGEIEVRIERETAGQNKHWLPPERRMKVLGLEEAQEIVQPEREWEIKNISLIQSSK